MEPQIPTLGVLVPCPACGGTGGTDTDECEPCGGCGTVVSDAAFGVLYPLAGWLGWDTRAVAEALETWQQTRHPWVPGVHPLEGA